VLDRIAYQSGLLVGAAPQGVDQRKRGLALGQIVAQILAGLRVVTGVIEHVVEEPIADPGDVVGMLDVSQIDRLEAALGDATGPDAEALRARIARLKGLLIWNLETQYPERLTEVHKHLRELNVNVDALTAQYNAFVRTRQAAMHSYAGYDKPIDVLRGRVADALAQLEVLMDRQGHVLETVAIQELKQRRERLEAYQNQARFAFADSYDRAAKAQAR
jgi:hypothetical protein